MSISSSSSSLASVFSSSSSSASGADLDAPTSQIIARVDALFKEHGLFDQALLQPLMAAHAHELSLEDECAIYQHTSKLFSQRIIEQLTSGFADFPQLLVCRAVFDDLMSQADWVLVADDAAHIRQHIQELSVAKLLELYRMGQLVEPGDPRSKDDAYTVTEAFEFFETALTQKEYNSALTLVKIIQEIDAIFDSPGGKYADLFTSIRTRYEAEVTSSEEKQQLSTLCRKTLEARFVALFREERLVQPNEPKRKENSVSMQEVLTGAQWMLTEDDYTAVLAVVTKCASTTSAQIKSSDWFGGGSLARQEGVQAYAQQEWSKRQLSAGLMAGTLTREKMEAALAPHTPEAQKQLLEEQLKCHEAAALSVAERLEQLKASHSPANGAALHYADQRWATLQEEMRRATSLAAAAASSNTMAGAGSVWNAVASVSSWFGRK